MYFLNGSERGECSESPSSRKDEIISVQRESSISFYLGVLATKWTKNLTKEIGDMGFGGEELSLGGCLLSPATIDRLQQMHFRCDSDQDFLRS